METPLDAVDRDFWSFQLVAEVTPPDVKNTQWVWTPIDRFILSALEKRNLQPLPEADRWTLLRRVTFDLTGLPPTPEEIDAFLADERKDAYERLVDRLLESSAYGERQAQHWLDLARFAETDGFEFDHVRPQAWRYRDWVIDALNRDLPYDQFLIQQLAGDEFASNDPATHVATGFLLCGPDMPDINLQEERRHNFLNGVASTVGEVFLGLQFGCVQCHDHKADPISIHDFYRLRAFFDPLDLFQDHPFPGADSEDPVKARIAKSGSKVPVSYVRVRGDFRRQGPIVQAAFPRIACAPDGIDDDTPKQRLDLARWMVSPEHPLTSRVIVNRLWQQHFGVGLCATPSDFGQMGDYPNEIELLDWLAAEMIRRNWSLKSMHRLMVTSSVYRTASRPSLESAEHWQRLMEADPENSLLGRTRRRRLDAELIRDAMLSAAGELNRQPGGPGVRPPLPPEVVGTLLKNQWQVTEDRSEHSRRSIYLFARRNLRFPLLEVFDKPDSNLSCSVRNQTTIAPQALHLLNSEFSRHCAQALAGRARHRSEELADQVEFCYMMTLGRSATFREQAAAQEFVTLGGETGLEDFCLGLLNLNEFVYLD